MASVKPYEDDARPPGRRVRCRQERAAEERRPLRDLVERSLRAELAGTTGKRGAGRAITWVTVKGELPPELDVSDRDAMHDRLRRG